MKKYTLVLAIFLAAFFSIIVKAEPVNCNSARDTVTIPGTALTVTCPASSTTPPPVTPPPVQPPATGCSESKTASVAGKTLRRQCLAQVTIMPLGTIGGEITDLGTMLGGTSWPRYSYSGYSPTIDISSGYYVALAFTPTAAGSIQLTANQSFGDGGTISVSTVPGAMAAGSAGYVCGVGRSAANGIYISTAGGVCGVTVGTTYYINLADVDAAGNNLCHNGRPGTCASSPVSYTLYTSQ